MSTPDPLKRIRELEDSIKSEKNSGNRQRMSDEKRRLTIELGKKILINKQAELDKKNPKVPENRKVKKI